MEYCTFDYKITAEGADLDAKALQKLSAGQPLTLERVYDREDTWEITVNREGKTLGMLDYADCVGIAPFMDDDSLMIKSAGVTSVSVKNGKTRAKDVTRLNFAVEYRYDENLLKPYTGKSSKKGFVPDYDAMAAMAVYRVLDGQDDIVMKQTHLNRYLRQIPVSGRVRRQFFDGDFTDGSYNFCCEVLFDEKFTKCKISANIYNAENDDEYDAELDEREKQTALTLVNHCRIFSGEDPLGDDIEVE